MKSKNKLIIEIERGILQWSNTRITIGNFESTAFLYMNKEFGHIHNTGELDIVFGKTITRTLLDNGLAGKHNYVPGTSITYRVHNKQDVQAGISLLLLSYLIHYSASEASEASMLQDLETRLEQLSAALFGIYLDYRNSKLTTRTL